MHEESALEIQVDEQWSDQVDEARLRRAIEAVFTLEGRRTPPALTLVLLGDEAMSQYHESYRGESGSTDVLTFPYEAEGEEASEEMAGYLGDVLIGYEQAARQAEAEGHRLQDELDLLAVHGTLHLLGYDDEEPEAKARMWAQQRRVMDALGLGTIAPSL